MRFIKQEGQLPTLVFEKERKEIPFTENTMKWLITSYLKSYTAANKKESSERLKRITKACLDKY